MSYPGSKGQNGTFHRIIGQMPPHSVYVECCYGSGKVFREKRPARLSILIDRSPAVIAKVDAVAGVRAMVGDVISVLPTLNLPADAVVYCDPPYVLSTRQMRIYYGENEMSDDQHAQLLTMLKTLQCRVMLSGYPCDLYSSQLHDWRCLRYQTMTRGGKRWECLWCNFAEPDELHDWRYAGRNFRERWGLTKLARRWLKNLEAMPPRKRGFVMNQIHQRHEELWPRSAPAVERFDRSAPELALGSGYNKVLAKIFEHKENGHPFYLAKCFSGSLKVFETAQRDQPFQAMFDAQDWAHRHGRILQFEQDFV